ncbi:MAG: hypothetical protein IH606_07055 [Burkholderiales bacterium]|nr:hypothetical protein [Burkholderiales bacterium]
MAQSTTSPELVQIALERAQGTDFERFAQDLMAALEGSSFVPLGGINDGGADGTDGGELFECERPHIFYQITVQRDHRAKIRQTVVRLLEVGREPKTLIFLTSRNVPQSDLEEEHLEAELGVRIRIRDSRYIVGHINDSAAASASFHNHLVHYTDFLKNIGAAGLIKKSKYVTDPSVYVFLQQEVENRLGNNDLIKTLTDSLILWALNDTDPDKGLLMSQQEILKKILDTIPWAKQFINAEIDRRLAELSSKGGVNGREIRTYKKEGKYCLVYETRQIVASENTKDESLRQSVVQELMTSARTRQDLDDAELHSIAEMTIDALELFFQSEGLQLSYFITNKDTGGEALQTVTDHIEKVLEAKGIYGEKLLMLRIELRELLTEMFYKASERQRYFLYSLSRTYVLLFVLRAEPRLIEFFQSMTSNFRLYVGSDVLIRALTERFLAPEDQHTRNMLKIARDAGVQLLLSEPILEEIYTHLRGTNFEFINHFAEIEPYVDRALARHSSKILIRTYFYAKEAKKVHGWREFMGQFIDYDKVSSDSGRDDLRLYLISQFSLEFYSKADLEALVDVSKVKALSENMLNAMDKKNEQLAYNDALMVYGVYGLRRARGETTKVTEFGLLTWWLTHETKIQKHTVELVMKSGSRYIMRPEFLLNYFTLAPSKAEVVRSYKQIFPSTLGLQMGHRMREDMYHKVLEKVKEWKGMEPGRVTAKLNKLNDTLKADQQKIYHINMKNFDNNLEELFFKDE